MEKELVTKFQDSRGSLQVLNQTSDIPFVIRRIFVISDVPRNEVRGEHAHRECHQFFWLLSGSVTMEVLNSKGLNKIELNDSNRNLHLPPLNWITMSNFGEKTVLMVLASHSYDNEEYISDLSTFRDLVGIE